MGTIKYKHAPVSEVILGVTFKEPILARNQYFITLLADLIREYPMYVIHSPLLNEELTRYQLNLSANPQVTGQVLYRLRTADNRWLIQFQWNKLYLNWVREDETEPGDYPGFTTIFNRFSSLLERILTACDATTSDILSCDMTYHDRIKWPDYVSSLTEVNEMVGLTLPSFGFSDIEIANFSTNLNGRVPEIGGYFTANILTTTEMTGKQILKLEFSLKGNPEASSYHEWFRIAHERHVDLFEHFVNKETLDKWQ